MRKMEWQSIHMKDWNFGWVAFVSHSFSSPFELYVILMAEDGQYPKSNSIRIGLTGERRNRQCAPNVRARTIDQLVGCVRASPAFIT